MCALLEVRHRPVLSTYPRAKLFKYPLFPRLPITSSTVLQDPVELLLRFSPALFDSRNEVLFMRMAEVARNISILQRLQRREGRLGIEMCDRACECGRINMGLCEQIIPVVSCKTIQPTGVF